MKFTNIAVRIAGVAMLAIPACVFAFEIDQGVFSWQDRLFSRAFIFSFLVIPLSGIPGLVIAAIGPLYGEVARENRRTTMGTISVLGLFILFITLIWPVGMALPDYLITPAYHSIYHSRWEAFLSNLYDRLLVCAVLWTILISLGLASLMSGRNLFCICQSSNKPRNKPE